MNKHDYDSTKLAGIVKASGFSQEELATRCNVKRISIGRAVRGEIASFALLTRIMQECSKPISEIIWDEPRGVETSKKFAKQVS